MKTFCNENLTLTKKKSLERWKKGEYKLIVGFFCQMKTWQVLIAQPVPTGMVEKKSVEPWYDWKYAELFS